MTTRAQVDRMLQAHNLDFISPNRVIRQGARSKCGMLVREGISYPDLIELLTVEEIEQRHYNDNALNVAIKKFTPMYTDFYLVINSSSYRTIPGQTGSTYMSLGYGLYYSRTDYKIEEDENYFYVSCTFDLYIDRRCTTQRLGRTMVTDYYINQAYARDASPSAPNYPEADTQLEALSERLSPSDTTRTAQYGHVQRTRQVPDTQEAREAYRIFLQRSRFPQIRNTAMDVRGLSDDKIRITNALHTCVAIKKTMKLKAKKDAASNFVNVKNPWLFSSRVTSSLRSGRIIDFNTKVDYAVQIVNNSAALKRHETRFAGLIGKDGKYMIAKIITTNEISGDLKSLLERKIQDKLYPETKSKRLLSMNAILETYTSEKINGVEILDISNVLSKDSGLTLVRVGDGRHGRSGNTLDKYCAIKDGVFKINIPVPSMLRKDKRKVKILPGEYVVCVNSDDADLITYNSIVTKDLGVIQVDAITSRLSLGGSSKKVRAKQPKRAMNISAPLKPGKKKRIRVTKKRDPFGKSKIKKEENKEDSDDEDFKGLGSLFG